MGDVVSVSAWGHATNRVNVVEKFVSCDKFIRSKVVPPPIGSIVFNFSGGRVTITGDHTHIVGDECEITIHAEIVCLNGSHECAVDLFCSIHREIEEIKIGCSARAEVVVGSLQNGQRGHIEDDALRGLIG
jgi:hypothetical protein